MSTDCKPDVAAHPPVSSVPWLGRCSKCGSAIERVKTPPPCHHKRMSCEACKHDQHIRNAYKWSKKNHTYELERNRQPHRKRKSVRNSLARNQQSRKCATMAHERWGIVEDVWLLEHAGKTTEMQMARKLGRSMKAIEKRLWTLRKEGRPNARVELPGASRQEAPNPPVSRSAGSRLAPTNCSESESSTNGQLRNILP